MGDWNARITTTFDLYPPLCQYRIPRPDVVALSFLWLSILAMMTHNIGDAREQINRALAAG